MWSNYTAPFAEQLDGVVKSYEEVDLPFIIELLSFEVKNYTGTTSPSDYILYD